MGARDTKEMRLAHEINLVPGAADERRSVTRIYVRDKGSSKEVMGVVSNWGLLDIDGNIR